jgi:iron complex outermembrane recepter protein
MMRSLSVEVFYIPALLTVLWLFSCTHAFPQAGSADTITSLGDVIVRGYETGRRNLQVPASVGTLRHRDLQRFANTSLVPAVSSIPGVRMEERSPGSYRLSIRGSLLRSPFGVRNIKVYQDDFILTDAGGNTYINLLDFNAVGSIEILRGPASSLYGTGTGGAVILSGPAMRPNTDSAGRRQDAGIQLTAGSYGQFSQAFRWQANGKKMQWQINQGHFQSDGYRENSRMRRDAVQAAFSGLTGSRNRIDGLLLFGNLQYRTPGGLTLAQMNANPRQARPATPAAPGAAEQKAGIRNTSVLAGISDLFRINEKWTWHNALTVMHTDFENPFITNYETRREWNIGIRSRITYAGKLRRATVRWNTGIEWQQGFYTIDSTGNSGGSPAGVKVEDKVRARQQFAFTQLDIEPFNRFIVQAGISLNDFRYTLERVEGNPQTGEVPVSFNMVPAPRFAILYLLTGGLSIHGSVSRGFSPPSIAEVRPSAGGFSTDLQAEQGWNKEIGLKVSAWRGRLHGDLTAFRFDLREAIVRRTDSNGAEFFVNAGGTRQQGIEAYVEGYLLPSMAKGLLQQVRLWVSLTLSRFRFQDYKVNNSNFSGNALTGVPPAAAMAGVDLSLGGGFRVMGSFQFTDPIPLNDANDTYAEAWRVWTARTEWNGLLFHRGMVLFAGVDNIGNSLYSLGNDLNAFGRRYYNPAAARNYFGGVRWNF